MAARRRTTRREHRNRSSGPRIIWRGAITFGLVHIPVALYRDDLLTRIRSKVRAGRMHTPSEPEAPAAERRSAQVIDLVEQLKKSLRGGKGTRQKAPVRSARRAHHARPHRRGRSRHAA